MRLFEKLYVHEKLNRASIIVRIDYTYRLVWGVFFIYYTTGYMHYVMDWKKFKKIYILLQILFDCFYCFNNRLSNGFYIIFFLFFRSIIYCFIHFNEYKVNSLLSFLWVIAMQHKVVLNDGRFVILKLFYNIHIIITKYDKN